MKALPIIHFNIMNMINKSMGYLPFQLHMGHSPRVLPPLVPKENSNDTPEAKWCLETHPEIRSHINGGSG